MIKETQNPSLNTAFKKYDMSKYKPTIQTSDYSDSELLEKLIETAKKLNKNSLTMDEFEANSRLSRGPYKRRWGWNCALKKAGLIPTIERNVDNEQILSDMKQVFDSLGRKPTKAEYNQISNFSSALLQRRFGGLNKAYHKLNSYIDSNGEISLPPIAGGIISVLTSISPNRSLNQDVDPCAGKYE